MPPSVEDDPSPSYTPLTVVDFPLYQSKWCCKCPTGPPIQANDNMVECSICESAWGCRVCHGIVQLSKSGIPDEIVVCFECASTSNDDSDILSSDNVGDEEEKYLSLDTKDNNHNKINKDNNDNDKTFNFYNIGYGKHDEYLNIIDEYNDVWGIYIIDHQTQKFVDEQSIIEHEKIMFLEYKMYDNF